MSILLHQDYCSRTQAEVVMRAAVTGLLAMLSVVSLIAPLRAAAQPPATVARVGVLSPRAGPTPLDRAFRETLSELGWREGRNVILEYRWAGGREDRLPEYAAELARGNVDVIFAAVTQAAQAAQKATATIPIVFATAADPVAGGLAVHLHPAERLSEGHPLLGVGEGELPQPARRHGRHDHGHHALLLELSHLLLEAAGGGSPIRVAVSGEEGELLRSGALCYLWRATADTSVSAIARTSSSILAMSAGSLASARWYTSLDTTAWREAGAVPAA